MPSLIRGLIVPLCVVLAACGGSVPPPPGAGRALDATMPLTAMRNFGPATVEPPRRSNQVMAREFMDLAFRMESGRPVPVFTRFEGPVTVRMTGPVPGTAARDLDRLIGRLRSEAGIDISRGSGRSAVITVEFLPRKQMRAVVPQAACFVAPNVRSWAEYRKVRRSQQVDWTRLSARTSAAVFIPSDTAPQEVRDCLHEEIAQALGPLNDLYELPDSVFNDDNIQGMLTGFDMLMLRTYYAPELRNGMSPDAVAARVPDILSRLNPAGAGGDGGASETPRAFISAIETTLGPRTSDTQRRAAASRATSIADSMGWYDSRAGFAWFLRGRLALGGNPEAAHEALLRAEEIYRSSALTRLHSAHIDMHLAAFALSQGRMEEAIARADRAIGPATGGQNAALLSTLHMVRAEAFAALGRPAEARRARADAVAWGRYGLGDELIARRFAEIGALSPARRMALR